MELVKNKGNKWIVKIHVQVEAYDFDDVYDKLQNLETVINKQNNIKVMTEVYG